VTAVTANRTTAEELARSAQAFCEDLIEEAAHDPRSMTNHPFMVALRAGEPTVDEVVEFATGMYRLVADAQRWTAAGYSQVGDLETRVLMLDSFIEEETGRASGTKSHGELVIDFIEALGQSRDETIRRSRQLRRRWQAFVDYMEFMGRCRPFWMYRGVSSLAGESQFSPTCELVTAAMQEHYGMAERDLTFWSVHISLDEDHTSSAVRLIGPYLDGAEPRRMVRDGVWNHMDLRYQAWLEPTLAFA
jgi:pyrroloquinoline quinone (PQQ) biosynthesis protein C